MASEEPIISGLDCIFDDSVKLEEGAGDEQEEEDDLKSVDSAAQHAHEVVRAEKIEVKRCE